MDSHDIAVCYKMAPPHITRALVCISPEHDAASEPILIQAIAGMVEQTIRNSARGAYWKSDVAVLLIYWTANIYNGYVYNAWGDDLVSNLSEISCFYWTLANTIPDARAIWDSCDHW